MKERVATACLAVTLLSLVLACSTGSAARDLTDHEIAMVVRTANDGEIQQGQVASPRLTDPNVREFAAMMVREHSAANDRAAAFFQSRNLTPLESSLSREVRSRAQRESQDISTLGGTILDTAYIDGQIRMHRDVLKMIDENLYPQARDTELRDFLTQMRVAVAQHMAQAEQIRRGMPR